MEVSLWAEEERMIVRNPFFGRRWNPEEAESMGYPCVEFQPKIVATNDQPTVVYRRRRLSDGVEMTPIATNTEAR